MTQLRSEIARTRADYGGLFTSGQVLNEPGRPDAYNQWLDFVFPGLDKFTFWNATILTASAVFWDEVENLAFERTRELLPERSFAIKGMFEPCEWSPTGKVKAYHMKEPPRFDQLGGLTEREYADRLAADIIRNEPPVIYEEFRTDDSYAYGIGLDIVIDAKRVDREVVEQAIQRFRDLGEAAWRSPSSVPRDRLPTMTRDEALAEARPAYSAGG
ncbi:hypothetical protein KXR53_22650 [Inquilinus limosus]|uniref:hypothetical protein n=1 Tax=Inquilinus limosus TaxID=171674 RepID=UPI003F18672D